MKINTDGVLLGVLAEADQPKTILDIGTGTGVIALILAQRYADAKIDAVEIDEQAAQTAGRNFENSLFANRVVMHSFGFEEFFSEHRDKKYDLVVSNPPFYINSLRSPQKTKELAKHADTDFFEKLVKTTSGHLTEKGIFGMILPVDTAELVVDISKRNGLFVAGRINIYSYSHSEIHRQILSLSPGKTSTVEADFVIYQEQGVHSNSYRAALKDFFTIF